MKIFIVTMIVDDDLPTMTGTGTPTGVTITTTIDCEARGWCGRTRSLNLQRGFFDTNRSHVTQYILSDWVILYFHMLGLWQRIHIIMLQNNPFNFTMNRICLTLKSCWPGSCCRQWHRLHCLPLGQCRCHCCCCCYCCCYCSHWHIWKWVKR